VSRAVQLRQEEAATQAVLEKMRDNPNAKLFEVHNEVQLLGRKMSQVLSRAEQSANTIRQAGATHPKNLGQ
jgi:hypothetical protein